MKRLKMAKLSQALANKAVTELDVLKVDIEPGSDGKRIAVLTLKTPIEEVRGSQRVPDPASNGQVSYCFARCGNRILSEYAVLKHKIPGQHQKHNPFQFYPDV